MSQLIDNSFNEKKYYSIQDFIHNIPGKSLEHIKSMLLKAIHTGELKQRYAVSCPICNIEHIIENKEEIVICDSRPDCGNIEISNINMREVYLPKNLLGLSG